MSMKVYYAYLYKKNASFSDVFEVQKYLHNLKERFIEWVPKDMIKWPHLLKLDTLGRIEQLEHDTKDPQKGGFWDYQLQCVVFCRTIDGVNYIAIQFFPSNPVARFLNSHVKLREFWYQDQTDDGFDLPDWDERDKFWNTVYDDWHYKACEAGLTYDIYDGTNFSMSDKIIRELAKLEASTKSDNEEPDER